MIIMKTLLRSLAPQPVLSGYRRLRHLVELRRARDMTAEEVFTEIYNKKRWAGHASEAFSSGSGSITEDLVSPYIAAVRDLVGCESDRSLVFVDLGCGDFRVGRRLVPLCARYIGVDVVRPLVDQHRAAHTTATVSFVHLDITKDELPDGDVCFVRQVFQHLSNEQILAVLGKLEKYPWVFITEHYPSDSPRVVPNRDKVHGHDTRAHYNSGVYLTEPPFGLSRTALTRVVQVPGAGMPQGHDPGVIRTFLYRPCPPSGWLDV